MATKNPKKPSSKNSIPSGATSTAGSSPKPLLIDHSQALAAHAHALTAHALALSAHAQALSAAAVGEVAASASCSNTVIGCIQQQSGGEDISDNPQLSSIHVNGGLLARCINLALGVNRYSSSDFLPSSTVQDCINTVCGYSP